MRLAKEFYGWDPNASFAIPHGVMAHLKEQFGRRGAALRGAWAKLFTAYRAEYPDLADQIDHMQHRDPPEGWDSALPIFPADGKGLATRDSSGKVLNAIAEKVPWLLGGAADLAPSTKTHLSFKDAGEFQALGEAGDYRGRNVHFGIREHAMCAIASGLSLSKLRPYASSFLIFTDYCRGALRLSAMMELPVIYIWTHDSISMGEDGPTHQPVEQLASFRAMPGMIVLRPADANEVVEAWRVIMQFKNRPICLVLTRQTVPTLDRSQYASASGVVLGAYILADAPDGKPDVLLLATGSEVSLCVTAYEQLKAEGIKARVISMPSWELFESQPQDYRDKILPPTITARVAVEEAATFGWERYTGFDGAILGLRTFGMSAPMKAVAQHFGFEPAHVVAAAREQLVRHAKKQ